MGEEVTESDIVFNKMELGPDKRICFGKNTFGVFDSRLQVLHKACPVLPSPSRNKGSPNCQKLVKRTDCKAGGLNYFRNSRVMESLGGEHLNRLL